MRLLGTIESSSMKSAAVLFESGDVLYGRLRPYLNKVIAPDFRGLASAEFIPLTPAEGVASRFVLYRLNSVEFVRFTSHLDEGDRPRVSYEQIGGFRLAVPPTPEQHRLVEALDSYFTRLDAAEQALLRAQANLKRYRASVLKAAVEGRLVPTEAELARQEGREYEPASVLLARILAERKLRWEKAELAKMKAKGIVPKDHRWKARYEEPAGPDLSGLPDLPEGWCWARAEQVSDFITKGTTPAADLMFAISGEIPYIKVYNLTFDGTLDFLENRPTFISISTHRELLSRSICLPGDVLMNIVGPPLGKVSIVPGIFVEWNINQAIARYRPLPGLSNEYLAISLQAPPTLRWAEKESKATAGQFNLTLETSRSLPIALPPKAEQERIVRAIESHSSVMRHVERSASDDLAHIARLRQSILKWAFEGKLVDQDPNDEPAAELLARIRTERATRPAGGKALRRG